MSEGNRNIRQQQGPRGGPGAMRIHEKPKNAKKTLSRLFRYLGAHKIALLVIAIMSAASTVLAVIAPEILGKATTALYGGVESGNWDGVWQEIVNILVSLGIIYLITQILLFFQNFIAAKVSARTIHKLRRDLSEKVHRLPLSYLDGKTTGELLSRVTNDAETVNMTLHQTMTQIITSVITIVGCLIMMFSINVTMALVAIIIIPLSLISSNLVIKKSQKYFRRQSSAIGDVNSHVEEMYTGHNIIKAFNYEEKSKERFDKINSNIRENAWRAEFFSGLMQPIAIVLGGLGYAVIAAMGCLNFINGRITQVGQIQSFLQYMKQFSQPISSVANMSAMLQSAIAAAERVFEVLDEDEEIADKENPEKLENIRGDVSIEHIKFGYSPDKAIIHDLTINVKSGQTIAIVGPTGAGKTTLINLLMRFYDVDGGSIKIDGVDIRDMKRDDLRGIFGMVLQDTWLFNGTVYENIAYGRDGATRAQVVDAAKRAYVHRFIKTLSEGYDMELNEEASNISQGQKQLLTIARVIVKDPAILILDEATSSVDTRTEVLIQKAMNELMKGRTSFVIAHRLSTIRGADTILVINDGDVVEQGNHEDLLAKGGFYASLYNSQFENAEVS